jgi:sec-independent protein translocase protein TatC
MLSRGRRYAVISILVLSAIITPPDIFSQVALAVPVYFLYELSILIVYLTGRKSRRDRPQEDPYQKQNNEPAG